MIEMLGWAAVAFGALPFMFKKDFTLRIANLIALTLWFSYLVLRQDYSAAMMVSLAFVMVLSSLGGFVLLVRFLVGVNFLVLVSFLYHNGLSVNVLPVLGGLLINMGLTVFDGRRLTVMCFLGMGVWVVFGAAVSSEQLIVSNLLGMMAITRRAVPTRCERKLVEGT